MLGGLVVDALLAEGKQLPAVPPSKHDLIGRCATGPARIAIVEKGSVSVDPRKDVAVALELCLDAVLQEASQGQASTPDCVDGLLHLPVASVRPFLDKASVGGQAQA